MLGSHLSVAGGMVNALLEAERLKMETVQVFTKNQRQWSAKPLASAVVGDWLIELHRIGWDDRTVSHASYLINMATPDPTNHAKSVDALTDEVERCETLEIPFCVVHPGSHLGEGLEGGIRRIAKAIDTVVKRTSGFRTLILIETTVGGGNLIGGEFEHLAEIRKRVREPRRVATCLDTCHISAAGYDISTRTKAAGVFSHFDRVVDLDNLRCFHLNDSKEPIASRRDRHEHIGDGYVGRGGFEFIMNEKKFSTRPMILETAKTTTAKGTPMDTVNIRRLRRMRGR